MKKDGYYVFFEIQEILQDFNVQWKDMCDKVKDKGSKFRQVVDQEIFNKALVDVQVRNWIMEINYFIEIVLIIINVGKIVLL